MVKAGLIEKLQSIYNKLHSEQTNKEVLRIQLEQGKTQWESGNEYYHVSLIYSCACHQYHKYKVQYVVLKLMFSNLKNSRKGRVNCKLLKTHL